jgi:hypothetical protein
VKKYRPHLEELATGSARTRGPMLNSASVSKDGYSAGLAVILRDAAKTPLLRMRSEIYSQPQAREKGRSSDVVDTQ